MMKYGWYDLTETKAPYMCLHQALCMYVMFISLKSCGTSNNESGCDYTSFACS